MGNSLGGRKKTTKIMKINGETMKLKTPLRAMEVVKDYPGLVLLDSKMVKNYGVRAKPLEPQEELKPKGLYFLVELPKVDDRATRRVRSAINMSAKDRLESLMLARRSVSDLSYMKSPAIVVEDGGGAGGGGEMRVKLRLRKAEVERLMRESGDEAEAVERIMKLCMVDGGGGGGGGSRIGVLPTDSRRVHWKDSGADAGGGGGDGSGSGRSEDHRVRFSFS